MESRLRIQHLLIVIAIIAMPLAMFAPELRSRDPHARTVAIVALIVALYWLVCFTPVWIVLIRLRNRYQRGLNIQPLDYFVLLGAILLGFALLLLTGLVSVRILIN